MQAVCSVKRLHFPAPLQPELIKLLSIGQEDRNKNAVSSFKKVENRVSWDRLLCGPSFCILLPAWNVDAMARTPAALLACEVTLKLKAHIEAENRKPRSQGAL